MDIRETDVDTLLIETWEQFSESARKKNICLNLDIEDHYPKIHCDKERISQVLGILLDNAISYSSPGQPTPHFAYGLANEYQRRG